jgi:hypothetical protein
VNREIARLETTLPRPWLDRLQTLARDQGKSLEEVTREAIATYLGLSPLEMEIAALKLQIGEIAGLSTQIAALHLRLSRLEGRTLPPTPPAPMEEEEYDDEPDEVLNDFLGN